MVLMVSVRIRPGHLVMNAPSCACPDLLVLASLLLLTPNFAGLVEQGRRSVRISPFSYIHGDPGCWIPSLPPNSLPIYPPHRHHVLAFDTLDSLGLQAGSRGISCICGI